jgi:GNAT superfamily N-acetyltransferase
MSESLQDYSEGKDMSNVEYVFMEDMTHSVAVLDMMNRLYAEDIPASDVDESRFPETLHKLLTQPQTGRIVLLRVRGKVQGYALLIPFWSNEYGGFLVWVDELFVMAEARRQGVGRGLFLWLTNEKPFSAVGIFLEVSPRNHHARRLYEQIGFTDRENGTMAIHFS